MWRALLSALNRVLFFQRIFLTNPPPTTTHKKFPPTRDPPAPQIRKLESCLKMEIAYLEQYRITKDKLAALPKGKQFDFSETLIFGRLQLFCRRVVKLIDMFFAVVVG